MSDPIMMLLLGLNLVMQVWLWICWAQAWAAQKRVNEAQIEVNEIVKRRVDDLEACRHLQIEFNAANLRFDDVVKQRFDALERNHDPHP